MQLVSITFAALALLGPAAAIPSTKAPPHFGKGLGDPLPVDSLHRLAARNGPGLGDPVPIAAGEPQLVARDTEPNVNGTALEKRRAFSQLDPYTDYNGGTMLMPVPHGSHPDPCYTTGDPHPGWGMKSWNWWGGQCTAFFYSGYFCDGSYLGSCSGGAQGHAQGYTANPNWQGGAFSWMIWCPGDP